MTVNMGNLCAVEKNCDDAEGGGGNAGGGGDNRGVDDDPLNAWTNRNYNTTYKIHESFTTWCAHVIIYNM